MFSKSCEYGLRAIIFIAQQHAQQHKVSLSTIAEAIDSPQAFTAKVLQQLTRSTIVTSIKGPHGGFIIEKDKMDTMLSEVVSILDGNGIYTGCGLGLKQCDANSPCPLHHKFIAIRNDLKAMLENTSLQMIVDGMVEDTLRLKR